MENEVENYPDFAVIWSFFKKFSAGLELSEVLITDLVQWFSAPANEVPIFIDVMVKLMRKTGMRVDKQRWQKHMVKVAEKHDIGLAVELQNVGFFKMHLTRKLQIFKILCELQFDDNLKFKNLINAEESEDQRLKPVGSDEDGLVYWHQEDGDMNIRLYVEDEEEDEERGWKVICRSQEDIGNLITQLTDEPMVKKVCEDSDDEENEIESKFQKFLKNQCTSEVDEAKKEIKEEIPRQQDSKDSIKKEDSGSLESSKFKEEVTDQDVIIKKEAELDINIKETPEDSKTIIKEEPADDKDVLEGSKEEKMDVEEDAVPQDPSSVKKIDSGEVGTEQDDKTTVESEAGGNDSVLKESCQDSKNVVEKVVEQDVDLLHPSKDAEKDAVQQDSNMKEHEEDAKVNQEDFESLDKKVLDEDLLDSSKEEKMDVGDDTQKDLKEEAKNSDPMESCQDSETMKKDEVTEDKDSSLPLLKERETGDGEDANQQVSKEGAGIADLKESNQDPENMITEPEQDLKEKVEDADAKKPIQDSENVIKDLLSEDSLHTSEKNKTDVSEDLTKQDSSDVKQDALPQDSPVINKETRHNEDSKSADCLKEEEIKDEGDVTQQDSKERKKTKPEEDGGDSYAVINAEKEEQNQLVSLNPLKEKEKDDSGEIIVEEKESTTDGKPDMNQPKPGVDNESPASESSNDESQVQNCDKVTNTNKIQEDSCETGSLKSKVELNVSEKQNLEEKANAIEPNLLTDAIMKSAKDSVVVHTVSVIKSTLNPDISVEKSVIAEEIVPEKYNLAVERPENQDKKSEIAEKVSESLQVTSENTPICTKDEVSQEDEKDQKNLLKDPDSVIREEVTVETEESLIQADESPKDESLMKDVPELNKENTTETKANENDKVVKTSDENNGVSTPKDPLDTVQLVTAVEQPKLRDHVNAGSVTDTTLPDTADVSQTDNIVNEVKEDKSITPQNEDTISDVEGTAQTSIEKSSPRNQMNLVNSSLENNIKSASEAVTLTKQTNDLEKQLTEDPTSDIDKLPEKSSYEDQSKTEDWKSTIKQTVAVALIEEPEYSVVGDEAESVCSNVMEKLEKPNLTSQEKSMTMSSKNFDINTSNSESIENKLNFPNVTEPKSDHQKPKSSSTDINEVLCDLIDQVVKEDSEQPNFSSSKSEETLNLIEESLVNGEEQKDEECEDEKGKQGEGEEEEENNEKSENFEATTPSKPKGRKKRKGRKRFTNKRKPQPVKRDTSNQSQVTRRKKPKMSELDKLKADAEFIFNDKKEKEKEKTSPGAGKEAYRTRSGRRVKSLKSSEPVSTWQVFEEDDVSSKNKKKKNTDEDFQFVEHKKRNSKTVVTDIPVKEKKKRIVEDDTPCMKCGLVSHPETILLCDGCNKGQHMACLAPPLMIVPDGDWFCPKCNQEKLIERLRVIYEELGSKMKLHQRKTRQNEYKKMINEYTGISSSNIIEQEKPPKPKPVPKKRKYSTTSESDLDDLIQDSYSSPSSPEIKTRKCRTKVSYDFSNFDKTIMEAIQSDIDAKSEEEHDRPISGKDIRTIIAAEKGERAAEDIDKEENENIAKRKRRKLNNLNSSEDEHVDSGSNYSMSSNDEMSEEEFQDPEVSESDSLGCGRRSSRSRKRPYVKPTKRSRRLRRKRLQEDFETSFSESSSDYEERAPPKKVKKRKRNGYGRDSTDDTDEYVPSRIARERHFINDDDSEDGEKKKVRKCKRRRVMHLSSDNEENGKGNKKADGGSSDESNKWSSLSSGARSSDEGSASEHDAAPNQKKTAEDISTDAVSNQKKTEEISTGEVK